MNGQGRGNPRYKTLNVRTKTLEESHLGQVIKFLEEGIYDIAGEVTSLLKIRFLPSAQQKNNGRIDPDIALNCLNQARALVSHLEEVCGVQRTMFAYPVQYSQGNGNSSQKNTIHDEDNLEGEQKLGKKIDLSNQVFDLLEES